MIKKTVTIKNGLTVDDVVSVARFGAKVRLSDSCMKRVADSRAFVEKIVAAKNPFTASIPASVSFRTLPFPPKTRELFSSILL